MKKLLLVAVLAVSGFCVRAQETPLPDKYLDAVALYAEEAYDEADSLFSEICAADTTADAAFYYRAMCRYGRGDTPGFEQDIARAIRLDSSNVWYRHALTTVYMATDRLEQAIPMMEDLLVEMPGIYNTPYNLAMLGDASLGQYRDSTALEYYQRALDLDPEYAPAEMGKAEIMRYRGNYPAFFVSLGKVIDNPDVAGAYKSGYLKRLFDRIDSKFYWVWGPQLEELISKCVELHPEDIPAHELRANIYAIHDDWDGVTGEYEQIAALAREAGDNEKLSSTLGYIGDVIYQERSDAKTAYKYYEQALQYNPDNAMVLNNYAYYLSLEGRKLRKAEKMSARTLELEPDSATYIDTYAWILHLRGKDAEAKPLFKRAMIFGGRDSATVLEHYSIVLRALGEDQLADYYKRLSEQK